MRLESTPIHQIRIMGSIRLLSHKRIKFINNEK